MALLAADLWIAVTLALVFPPPATAQLPSVAHQPNLKVAPAQSAPNITGWASGAYEYRTLSTGQPRGRETFQLVRHPDGGRTMIATTDIYSRNVNVTVVFRADAAFRPEDVYVNIRTQGRLRGAGFYRVQGKGDAAAVTATVTGPAGPHTSETATPAGVALICHPLALDGWTVAAAAKTPDVVQSQPVYMINGAPDLTRPMLGDVKTLSVVYRGRETITVPAGVFEADRYTLDGHSQLWVAGPDRILVRYVWENLDRDYVLTRLETGGADAPVLDAPYRTPAPHTSTPPPLQGKAP